MRATLFTGLMVLAMALGAGCEQFGSSSDGGGTGGQGGTSASTGGSGGHAGVGAGGSGGAAATDCSPACGSGQICVGTGTEGGAAIAPNDAGVCPAGSHPDPGGGTVFCQRDLSYACASMPSACGGTLTCTCAASICPTTGPYTCQVASASELLCVQQVP